MTTYCTKVCISVQKYTKLTFTCDSIATKQTMHHFCVFIVYIHFEMPVFGRHTKT